MNKFIIVSLLTAAVVSGASAHEGHSHATGVVRERMELMTSLGERLLAISKRLRANKGLDSIADNAHAIHELAPKITKQFPPGSTQSPTAAKPAVWQDWEDFRAQVKNLETEAEKLMQINIADGELLREQFRNVAHACDGCHQKYRRTK